MSQDWEGLLSEHDRKVLEARPPKPRGNLFGHRPAVVVIDMNVGALGEDKPAYDQQDEYPGACGETGWAALRSMKRLISTARDSGLRIVFSRNVVRVAHGMPRGDDPTWMYSELSPLSELSGELLVEKEDLVIEKQRASIFFQTNLIYMLLENSIDTLILVGNSTSGCVRASAIDAVGYGFKTSVVEECVFDRFELSHRASLFDLQFKYCDIVPLNRVMEFLEVHRKATLRIASGED